MLVLPVLDAIWIATDAARELRDDLVLALTRAGISRKDAGYYMRLSEQQLCDQLALRHPLNVWRLADLPLEFWREFLLVRAKRTGQAVLEDAGLLRLVDAVQALTVTQKKPMAKAALPDERDERQRA